MKERFSRWAVPLFHVAGVLAWGYVAMHFLMRAFPPSESEVLAIASLVVFWLFVSGVAYLLVLLAVPGGWAERGIWRFTLFGAGFVFLSMALQAQRIAAIQKAGYTTWPVGGRWVVGPSVPRWITRLIRRWRQA